MSLLDKVLQNPQNAIVAILVGVVVVPVTWLASEQIRVNPKKEDVTRLEKKLEDANSDFQSLNTRLEQAQGELEKKTNELEVLKSNNISAPEVEGLRAEVEELQTNLVEQEQSIAALKKDNDDLMLEKSNLEEQIAQKQEIINELQNQIETTKINSTTQQENLNSLTPESDSSTVQVQEVSGIKITLLRSRRNSSNDVLFEFKVENVSSSEQSIDLFGGGSFGNGNSRMFANGSEYAAINIQFGDEQAGIVGKRLPANVTLNAFLGFRGVPTDLQTIDVLELAYSYNNLIPAGYLQFRDISIE